ncbi:MAG TPA: Flp pilus assembly protein CpaB [Thermoflexia bacterium]|nr:Flp pilus assembly protein CpaB [Thermoflexia bacterium]
MSYQRKTALLIAAVLGLAACLLVFLTLSRATKTQPVVVAARYLPAGTVLSRDDVDVENVPTSAVPEGAFSDPDQVVGKTLGLPRAEGDVITFVAFEQAAVPVTDPTMRAVALDLTPAQAGGGLIRPGFYVDVIAEFPPDILNRLRVTGGAGVGEAMGYEPTPTPIPYEARPTPTPRPAPAARIVVSHLRVLYVSPWLVAAEPAEEEEGRNRLAPVRTTASARAGVVVLEVPVEPVEIDEGFRVSLPALLAILNNEANVHLAIAPPSAAAVPNVSVRLEDLFAYVAGANPGNPTLTPIPPTPTPTATPTITATETVSPTVQP